MPLPYLFANSTGPQMPWLDADFAAVGALTVIPCAVSGSTTLMLTPFAQTPSVLSYGNYMAFSGIAPVTNTGAFSAFVSGLTTLPVYRDTSSGPIAPTGGELVAGNYFILLYDLALNAGAGGFHLLTRWHARQTLAIAAAGSTQATATPVHEGFNQVATVATSTGVILAGVVADSFVIVNRGANALTVYPPVGAAIDGNAINAGVSVASNATARYWLAAATQIWSW